MVYRKVRPVDIGPFLALLPETVFKGAKEKAFTCAWVTGPDPTAPEGFLSLVDALSLGGESVRVVLRLLKPHRDIPEHTDMWEGPGEHGQRFLIPLISHPDIVMRWPVLGLDVHLESGWLYQIGFGAPHSIHNPTNLERIHLQIDQVGATV